MTPLGPAATRTRPNRPISGDVHDDTTDAHLRGDGQAWLAWVPVSSQYALLTRALRGEALPALELAQSYAVPALLTLGALLLVARLLSRESMLAAR